MPVVNGKKIQKLSNDCRFYRNLDATSKNYFIWYNVIKMTQYLQKIAKIVHRRTIKLSQLTQNLLQIQSEVTIGNW